MAEQILISCRDMASCKCLLELFRCLGTHPRTDWSDADLLLEVLNRNYRVIIYDIEESDWDGLKMVKILRIIRPKVALVVISKDSSRELGGQMLHQGVTYYAVKPLNPDAINTAVLKAVAGIN